MKWHQVNKNVNVNPKYDFRLSKINHSQNLNIKNHQSLNGPDLTQNVSSISVEKSSQMDGELQKSLFKTVSKDSDT